MATSMAVDTEGSVEKRMNMSLDEIIKESSKTKKGSGPRGKGVSVSGKRGKGGPAGKIGRKPQSKAGAGKVLVVPRPFADKRQDAMAKRRGLQATGGQQARKALRPQAPIRKGAGRAPLRIPRGGGGGSGPRRDVSNITVSIQNNRMPRAGGSANVRRPIIPTAASNLPPRRQPQQRYVQPQQSYAYQQPVQAFQPPAYYGGGARGGGGLAPLGPSTMDPAPVEYRQMRRSEAAVPEMPAYAQHDYRDGPPPNYEMEGARGGSMYADRELIPNRSRGPSLSGYTNTAERMQYAGTSSQRERRNARGYIMP